MGILTNQANAIKQRMKDDGFPTETSMEQKRVEDTVLERYVCFAPHHQEKKPMESIRLFKERHTAYLVKGLEGLGSWGSALDASKPWLIYWITHSLDLLDYSFTAAQLKRLVSTFHHWQLPSGGFGGGGDQLGHLATTYAAVNALAIAGTQDAYRKLDRKRLYEFLMRMKQADGSFTMHEGGEIDIRGSYCALHTAALTNLLTPELTANCIEFIARSQTYEGGIGPYPGKEAHNGYTFCGLAAMEILDGMDRLDLDRLTRWCTERQMGLEGGFQGRTNKLVDGCYSFWGAGDFPLLKSALARFLACDTEDYLFDREGLQEYVLLCCQSRYGGLVDKPGKGVDYYHTCYCLSGLSVAQHRLDYVNVPKMRGGLRSLLWKARNEYVIVGDIENCLQPTHPVHNISLRATRDIIAYFYDLKPIAHLLPQDDPPLDQSLCHSPHAD
ncbi:terpenoid cyclases/protein prenyltransferase alpha-alpha toroid [Sporodiniella umbellata]|nr:terpenoid cyclases/protein prenyltransferase alpha-alpha toroid [Sporodiniella umbellata]